MTIHAPRLITHCKASRVAEKQNDLPLTHNMFIDLLCSNICINFNACNTFIIMLPFLYPLKTSENQTFSGGI